MKNKLRKIKKITVSSLKNRAVHLDYQRDNIKELADELGISPERIINNWQ